MRIPCYISRISSFPDFDPFFPGATSSIDTKRASIFSLLNSSRKAESSPLPMIMIPFFFIGVPFSFGGLISMASEAGLLRVWGSLMMDTPFSVVFFLSQSSPVSRNARKLSVSSMSTCLPHSGIKVYCVGDERKYGEHPSTCPDP
jgi:hypothetical protein